MSRKHRSAGSAGPGRSRYTPPDPSSIQQISLGDLLPRLQNPQRQLAFDESTSAPERIVWCAGNTGLLTRAGSVAIVGTRSVSADGAARARRLATELAERHVVVVSGLAKGVDTEALTAAIDAGGAVIAVIGTPLDEAYPIENASLQETIARDHLLISQFQQGSKTFPGRFPERNRLMAAISDVTAIIEAGDMSGTLHQAAECVRLGRWLFIAKNAMEDPALTWPSQFKNHPHVRTLTQTSDILDILNI
jgi:DNA processing protein